MNLTGKAILTEYGKKMKLEARDASGPGIQRKGLKMMQKKKNKTKTDVKKVVIKLIKIFHDQFLKQKFLKGGASISNRNNHPRPYAFCQESKDKEIDFFRRLDKALSKLV